MRAAVALLIILAAQPGMGQQPTPFFEDISRMPVSPEVYPDRRVTFRLLAPKASEVLLAGGNLQEALKGAQPLKKDDQGVWSITVGPLEPGLYDYGFAVDGGIRTTDPANRNAVERTWGHTNFVEVPGDRPAFYSLRPVRRGTIHIHAYDSKSLSTSRRVYVYTPPGYEQSGNTRYPVLYLFHGSGGVESQWTELGRANVILDNLIADGRATPMIVVMPYGHVPQTTAGGRGRIGSAGFDRDLLSDIIPLVDENYRTLADRDHRAIAGLSMGGGQSLSIGLAHLDLFSYVASFSGALRNVSDIEKMDPAALNQQLKVLWIGCGKADSLFEASQKLASVLGGRKVRHVFRVSEGGHTWTNWRLYLYEFAPLLFPEEPGFVDHNQTEPAGTKYKTFYSRTIKGQVSYLIYLPPDYETSPRRRYPVVYWLHGRGGTQRSCASFVAQLDAAVKAGKAPPMIVVGVNGLRDKWYYDSFDRKLPVETVFIKDLIPHIDKSYRTLARRQFRAVEGYSMGGFGAAHLGFKYPELFGAVSIMAGAMLDADGMARTADLFKNHFGDSKAYFNAGDPSVLVREHAGQIRGRMFVRVGVGDRDSLLERNRKYHELLDGLNIRHEYFTVAGVAHEMQRYYELLGSGQFAFYQKAFQMAGATIPLPGPGAGIQLQLQHFSQVQSPLRS